MSELLEFLRTHDEAFRSRARLASLYSDFRYQRHSNPDGYHANVTAWLRALTAGAGAGLLPSATGSHDSNFVVHTGDSLARALQTQDLGRPLALGAVVEEAIGKKAMLPLKEFLGAKGSVYAKSWVPSVGDVVKWGLKQLGVGGSADEKEDRLMEGDFVMMGNVEAAADKVQEWILKYGTSRASRIFSRDRFAAEFADVIGAQSLGPTDVSILLTFLERDRSVLAYSKGSKTLKFKSAAETQPAPVTDDDVSIASLRSLMASIRPQIENLEMRVSELDKTARNAVAKKQLSAAKTALRSKKLVESSLSQRTDTLYQLEQVYYKLETAADQVEMVRVMEAAGHTLRSLNKQTGGVEKVQDIMDDLREQMMDVDEIGDAINADSAATVDDGEVEDELEALEKVEREKIEAAEREAQSKKDEIDAEETRKKLAELDQMGEKAKAEETKTPPNEPLRPFEEKKEGDKVAETVPS